jgi:hypothetical protein
VHVHGAGAEISSQLAEKYRVMLVPPARDAILLGELPERDGDAGGYAFGDWLYGERLGLHAAPDSHLAFEGQRG